MSDDRRRNLYRTYLEFVQTANQKDRLDVSRRMRSVFLWCFLIPVVIVAVLIALVNYGAIPRSYRGYLDWILLFFPVFYSLYFLGSQVLAGIPEAFRRGGLALTLGQTAREADWRFDICTAMEQQLKWSVTEWSWVIANVEEDLDRLQMRVRHLTALAGAVFYLLMQGIDSLTGEPRGAADVPDLINPISSEWVGLALFLLLLYLSGQQNVQTLRRFLACARLVRQQRAGSTGV
jgi:hypothetical protein